MSHELNIDLGVTGLTVTANVYLLGVLKESAIACAEIGVTGKYSGDFAATPNVAGTYQIAFFVGAETVSSGGGQVVWDGSAEVVQTGDSFARIGAPAGASVSADMLKSERNVRQVIESQRGHHTGCGAIFYVQKGGNDANPGTYALPFLTIQAALNACTANAHDTVIVLGVTGSSPSIFTEAITMSKAYVFLRGMGRDTRITTAGAASSTITVSANGCEISGLHINNTGSGATKGVEAASGSDFTWIHHTFIDGAATGIHITAGANTVIEHNRINDCATAGVNLAQGGAVGLHTSILYNHIDGSATGINFSGNDSSESVAKFNNISACTTGVVVASGALKIQVTDNRFAGNTTDWTDAGTNTNLNWNTFSTTIAGAVSAIAGTTQTLDALQTAQNSAHGSGSWATATGFSTHAAADVWSVATRVLTAGTNIALAKGVGVTGFTDLSAADVRTAVGLGSANLDTQLADLPTAAENADAVWDEAIAGHAGVGSTGEALSAAGSAGDPWSTAIPGAYGAGTAGKIVGDNINATISSRASQTSVDDVPTNAELATALGTADDATLAAIAALNNISAAQVNAEVDTALADVGLTTTVTGRIDEAVSAAKTLTSAYDAAKTAATQTSVDDLPTNAELATALGTADDATLAQVALVKAKTDLIPAAPAAVGDIPTASTVAAAVWAYVVEGSTTAVQLMRGFAAALLGKASGLETTTAVYRDIGDTKARITATVDADGNRTAVTRDLT